MAEDNVRRIEQALLQKAELLRPGFTRVSFPYFMAAEEVDYILAASVTL